MKRNIIIGLLLAAAAWCGMWAEKKACQRVIAVIPFQLPDPPEGVDPCEHYVVEGYDCKFTPNSKRE